MNPISVLRALLLALIVPVTGHAADNVRIGVIYPLTGNAASAGASAKDAVELGAEIVNNAHPELPGIPLAATAGLPNLAGAKIELSVRTIKAIPRSARTRPCG